MRRGKSKGHHKNIQKQEPEQEKKTRAKENQEGLEEEVRTGAVVNPMKARTTKWAYSCDMCSCQAAVWTRRLVFCILNPR